MATVSKERLRARLEAAIEDVALIEAGHLRGIAQCSAARKSLGDVWTMAELGDVPEFEPEIRVRQVSA